MVRFGIRLAVMTIALVTFPTASALENLNEKRTSTNTIDEDRQLIGSSKYVAETKKYHGDTDFWHEKRASSSTGNKGRMTLSLPTQMKLITCFAGW